jgi:SpoVK/Ycf46/Vps4 family AAA+-type ATPase
MSKAKLRAGNLEHVHNDDAIEVPKIDAKAIPKVELMSHLKPTEELIFGTLKFFFSKQKFQINAPFKGFIICGPVGTGKTELAKQVSRKIASELPDVRTNLIPVDSAVVASPKWGEAEAIFRSLFNFATNSKERAILLFDDVESLFLSRGAKTAREWHYSLSSLFFHLVDSMNPSHSMVLATTNRPDLIDAAITTRLYSVNVSRVPIKQLLSSASQMIDQLLESPDQRQLVFKDVQARLRAAKAPTIRDCRQFVIISCIENKVFS